jgi:pyridoxal phosphate enzyme (YggS family)
VLSESGQNPAQLQARYGEVLARIARAERESGRAPGSVQLLAVSKAFSAESVRSLARLGQRHFGESYLQEALHKQAALTDLQLVWHFIGPLQSNKTRGVAEHFSWAHSVDRSKIARRLSGQRPGALPPLNVCLQVNLSGETSKSGVTPQGLAALAEEVSQLPALRLRGLMSIPAPTSDTGAQREAFRRLRNLFEDLSARGLELDTLSIGMSADLEAAVAEGATIVRIGTALFGPRSRSAAPG